MPSRIDDRVEECPEDVGLNTELIEVVEELRTIAVSKRGGNQGEEED